MRGWNSVRWSHGPDPADLEKYGIHGMSVAVKPAADDLNEIIKLVEKKESKPIVTQTLPLGEAAKALQQAATHHTRGKMVLKIADEPKS